MKNVCILVPETAVPAAIVDPRYMFTAVNGFYQNAGHEPFFNVQLVGLNRQVVLSEGQVIMRSDALISDIQKTDLVIIPALSGNLKEALRLNDKFLPWIIRQYNNGAEVASLCVGAFLLAATGLMNGRDCSTHWLFANDFRDMFPEVRLADDKIITDQNGLYSSGGATSYWNLLLYLVEKYTSREMAITASKFFLLDIGKNSQLPFSMFRGQKEHSDEIILAVQEYIEKNFSRRLTIEELAGQFNLGRRTFERRFKKATANTVIEYLQRVKVEAAKKLLESGRKTVQEVMYDVGYNDLKAFRDVFRKITGMSPADYMNRYRFEYSRQTLSQNLNEPQQSFGRRG
jgi:transcriptional regulator GlxA family with amidase domain